MAIVTQIRNEVGTILMSGRFDFTVHREFKSAYMSLLHDMRVREIEVEMRGLDFIDSSALGMLMLLHERAGEAHKKVALLNAYGVVLELLAVANFHRLFDMRPAWHAA